LAFDELHGVVVDALFAADGEDGDDVGVVELRGGLGFYLETAEVEGIEGGGEGEDLEGHAAVERELLGLEDDAHAAAADRAEDLEVAEAGVDGGVDWGCQACWSLDLVGELEDGEAGAEAVGQVGVGLDQGFGVSAAASFDVGEVSVQDAGELALILCGVVDAIFVGLGVERHRCPSSIWLSFSRARVQSMRTAPGDRFILVAI
jgi:hypothetical protein